MAKRNYRLEALLRLKDKEKKQAEIYLAKALIELKEAKKFLEELKEEKKKIQAKEKEAKAKMSQEMASGGLVATGCIHVHFLRKLKEDEEQKEEEIEEQKGVIEECEKKVARARRDYIEAVKQLRVMQKHKELWRKKIRQEISRREEKEMDELGQTIHSLRSWRGEKSVFQI